MGADEVVSKLKLKGKVEIRPHPLTGENVETIIVSRRTFDDKGYVWNIETTIPVQDFINLYETIKKNSWWLEVFNSWIAEGLILESDI
jgi:hypothetical protein